MQALAFSGPVLADARVQRPATAAAPHAASRALCPSSSRLPVLQVSAPRRHARQECRCAVQEAASVSNGADPTVPIPVVKIDNQSDPFATILTVQFGDRLGDLLDTIRALKNLGLNIRRAKISADSSIKNKFYITDAVSSEKVVKSAKIEEIRLTVLNNLLEYHPESAEELAWGPKSIQKASSFDATHPLGLENRRHVISTFIDVTENEAGTFTVINLRTLDRPGLLVDVVRVLKDISVNVVSAEVDTEGKEALDTFYVTYHGEPLSGSMVQLVTNCLQYYLSMAEVEREESY